MTFADSLDILYEALERQLLQFAEAMPADKYNFRPSPGVRTFGEQLRHVGAVQWVVGSAMQGSTPSVDVGDGDSGPSSMTAKDELLKYLRDSFQCIREAIRAINEHNVLEMIPNPFSPAKSKLSRLALAVAYACHACDHYGQLVVYLRLNGIVPPPSRPK